MWVRRYMFIVWDLGFKVHGLRFARMYSHLLVSSSHLKFNIQHNRAPAIWT